MLDTNLKQQLRTYLANLKTPVELVVALDDSSKSQELHALAQDIDSLSDLVSLTISDDSSERTPSMLVKSAAKGTVIRFAGLPMGHEFTSLVLALLHSGGHPMKIDESLIEQVRQLEGDFQFETYVSLSCQNCPEVIQALNMMAAINPRITNVMIDGSLFQEEVTSRNVMAVPTVFLNGKQFAQGRMTLPEILNKVDSGASKRKAAELSKKEEFDFLVVGAGPAGAAASIYAARKGIRTGIVTDRFGGQVLDTVGIENFISVKATEGPKLVANLEEHVRDYEVDIMSEQQAKKLSVAGHRIHIELENGATLSSKSVLLSTGARWREMNVPGEKEYRGKGVAYCPHCDGPLFKSKKVAVIGGGNSGIEAAIDLAGIVEHVTVLEFGTTLKADDVLQRKARSLRNVSIITEAQTTEVLGDGQRVTGLTYTHRGTGDSHKVELAGIFVQIGLVPNTEWLKDSGIELSRFGEIVVGPRGETSLPGVFAAGDVTNVPYKQIIIAMGSGANAALGAFDHLIRVSAPAEEAAA
ncbi:alkyl hydroperoxide reductase subunit F [Pokkaliibacter sp. CJK22405]|uniref:alkyl hydroperoxide reductase subunit F n=1 Tax=Pokkaliibacter sp. CJK22405 TaxID=3384615 RepID=UPI003984D55A